MESKYNIKKNGYVQPYEIRHNVVQTICDHIIGYLDRCPNDDYEIELRSNHPKFYLYIRNNVPSNYEKAKTMFFGCKDDSYLRLYDCYRVRSCEMRKVFKLLQDAGYHIYFDKNYSKYWFSIRPYLFMRKAEYIGFEFFID